jgi:hypothetical protein
MEGFVSGLVMNVCFVATGSWPVKENPCAEKLHSLIEHYKIVALRERAAKEKKNYTPRRPYSTYTVITLQLL